MGENTNGPPPTLRVFRYRLGEESIRTIIGPAALRLPHADLATHAMEALATSTFMFYTVAEPGDFFADELCFVPKGDRCDILSIHTNGWQRRQGDLRRSLLEILNHLAAAVACGNLLILDRSELVAQTSAGDQLIRLGIEDSASLALAREATDLALGSCGVSGLLRQRTVLSTSEAVTNMLLHGGGRGTVTLRRLDNRLRIIVADQGAGLNFLNWKDESSADTPASMGYGLKIILDYLDSVGLHSGPTGTTLILDRKTD